MTGTAIDRDALAQKFSKVLREWLTPEQMLDVVRLNKDEADKGICHSHDYCDANEAMNEAFKYFMGRDCYLPGDAEEVGEKAVDEDMAAWNAAWEIAKRSGFSTGADASADSEEEDITDIANAFYGEAFNSGGNIWLAKFTARDGRLIVVSADCICDYASEQAFINGDSPLNTINR
jgi:hypothetical protein